MKKGYSEDPRAYGIPIHRWDITRKGRELLAEVDMANRPGPDGLAPCDFEYGNDRKFVPVDPRFCDGPF